VAYNTYLQTTDPMALRHFEDTLTASTTPTLLTGTDMWEGCYLEIFADLASAGVTIGTGNDLTYAQKVEAFYTSAVVNEAAEIQTDGEVSEHTEWLMKMYETTLEKLKGRDFAASLGATVVAKGPKPRSLATEYANDDLDLDDIENPLPEWTEDQAL